MEAAALQARAAPTRLRWHAREAARAGLIAVTALAVVLRFASFGRVPANPYYDAAVRSMGLSWHNFFYGAYEPAAQVSIDKTPVDLWLQVASVKLLGFSSVALRLPEALAGAVAVPLLYDLVRRIFGRAAGLTAAAALAVMPIAVLTARSDTMDSVMMLLLVAAGWLIVVGAQQRRGWPVIAAGAVMGLAFNVKLFEALVALPALVLLAALAADLPWRRRARHLAGAACAFVGVALSWVTAASLAPLGARPYPIGSTNGGVWNVVFGFNGLDRVRSGPTAAVAAFDPTGPGRLFSTGGRGYGMLIGAVLAGALVLGALALADAALRGARRGVAAGNPSTRLRRAGVVFFATWLVSGLVLFSAMGRLQVRYLEAFTPAVAAVLGIALTALAAAACRRSRAAWALAAGGAATAALAPSLSGAPAWSGALGLAGAGAAVIAAAMLPRTAPGRPARVAGRLLAAGALVAVFANPLASSVHIAGSARSAAQRAGTSSPTEVTALSRYLRAQPPGARYETASSTVAKAAPLIIRDARPVLMLTSLYGRPLLTPSQLAGNVQRGEVRFAMLGRGTCSSHSARPCAPVVRWARDHATDVSTAAGLRPGTLSALSATRTR